MGECYNNVEKSKGANCICINKDVQIREKLLKGVYSINS